MTESCQTKFTEKFENQNYVIYGGILVASLAVLYVYRFHFATIAFSYVLGCVACYYGLNSNILDSLVNKIKCHSALSGAEEAVEESGDSSCATCGSSSCLRHDVASSEPWVGLHVHKQLDLAIEKFYNAILEQFIKSWHGRLAARPYFVDELRLQLRRASAILLRRALQVNYSRFLLERLIPCALRHYTAWAGGDEGGGGGGGGGGHPRPRPPVHPAAANRTAELKYLRSLTDALMPHLLDSADLNNPVFSVLVREIFAGWVLLPLADVLADPYILNALVILATGEETMGPLPATPDYTVEFLSSFAAGAPCTRARLLRVELERLLGEPPQLYAFMQHVKSTPHLRLLQLYNDLKQFQTKLLNPSLSSAEQAELCREGGAMLARHAHARQHRDLRAALHNGTDIRRLQTSPALFAAAHEAHAALDGVLLPRFLHSDEFYKLLIGSRIPTGYQKQSKRQGAALRGGGGGGGGGAGGVGGLVLESVAPDDEHAAADILAYLDRLAADDDHDPLSAYKVTITNVDTRLQAPPRSGTVRVFTLCVYCGGRLWDVQRSEHDFHLLRCKLAEFHGEAALAALALPARRDNSPDETLRYKYEDFVQRALQQPLLQGSALLRLFLSAPGEDFARALAAAALGAAPDLQQLVHSVTQRLRKEKGQHLDAFLRNYLLSADMERYQALKQGAGVEEAREADEVREGGDVVGEGVGEGGEAVRRRRDPRHAVFGDNFGVSPDVRAAHTTHQDKLVGFSQCLMYLLRKVVRARSWVCRCAGGVLGAVRGAVDDGGVRVLQAVLGGLAGPRRMARLVALGHDVVFGSRPLPPRPPAGRQRAQARAQLQRCVPRLAALALGGGLPHALDAALDLLQRPHLNKQLVYNLLDLCVIELFPELSATDNETNEPKS